MAEDAVFQAGNSLFGDIMVLDYSRFSAPHISSISSHPANQQNRNTEVCKHCMASQKSATMAKPYQPVSAGKCLMIACYGRAWKTVKDICRFPTSLLSGYVV